MTTESRPIIGKWKWIAEACDAKGYKEAAMWAWKLHERLKELYGSTLTEKWIDDWFDGVIPDSEKATFGDIKVILFRGSYCIACVECKGECSLCYLNKDYSGVGCGIEYSNFWRCLNVV